MMTEIFLWVLPLLTTLLAVAATLHLTGGLNLNGDQDRAEAERRARAAVAGAGDGEGVALLVQVLSDLETDLETVVRHCDFEGDSRNLILEGWFESRGGLAGMEPALRMPERRPYLESAGLIGPPMEAKASAYYYWRAMAGLDRFVEATTPPPGTRTPWYENRGTGEGKRLFKALKRNAPKALRIGDIVADSAIAVLDIPGMSTLVAAADTATGGMASVGVGLVKTAAHGTTEMKKIVEEAKISGVHAEAKRSKAERSEQSTRS